MVFNNFFIEKHKEVNQVLDYFKSITEFPLERVFIDGENIFINPISYTTKDVSDCIYEAHFRYIDVHFMYEGVEEIHISSVDLLNKTSEYNENDDYYLLSGKEQAKVLLYDNDYLVCYPKDAHKVGISVKNPLEIKKLVAKIRI